MKLHSCKRNIPIRKVVAWIPFHYVLFLCVFTFLVCSTRLFRRNGAKKKTFSVLVSNQDTITAPRFRASHEQKLPCPPSPSPALFPPIPFQTCSTGGVSKSIYPLAWLRMVYAVCLNLNFRRDSHCNLFSLVVVPEHRRRVSSCRLKVPAIRAENFLAYITFWHCSRGGSIHNLSFTHDFVLLGECDEIKI